MRSPGPGDGHVALHGNGGHREDRRHDGHVGHKVRHPAEDQSEYPVSVNRDMNEWRYYRRYYQILIMDYSFTYSSWRQSWMYCWILCWLDLPHRGWRWKDLWPSAFFCSLTNKEINSNVAAMENMKKNHLRNTIQRTAQLPHIAVTIITLKAMFQNISSL